MSASEERRQFMEMADLLTTKRREILEVVSNLDSTIARLVQAADDRMIAAADEKDAEGRPKVKEFTYTEKNPTPEQIADHVKPGKKCSHCVSLGLDGRGHNKRTCPNLHIRPTEESNDEG